jgi:polyphosphate glucokinase
MADSARAGTPSGASLAPVTLCIDVGGTGLKASVVDAAGVMLTERVRVAVEYPMGPRDLVDRLAALTAPLPDHQRVSVGFPGVVRRGGVLTAPHFVTAGGPGSAVDESLVGQWTGFDLASAVAERFAEPTRVINDADLQGLDVMTGVGVEMVITLGTGVGTCIIDHGVLGPHLELAHHPFRHGETYDEQLGNAARKRVGKRKWNKRVAHAVVVFDALVLFDTLYVGGGNARRVEADLGPKVKRIDPNAGIRGGVKLWNQPEM